MLAGAPEKRPEPSGSRFDVSGAAAEASIVEMQTARPMVIPSMPGRYARGQQAVMQCCPGSKRGRVGGVRRTESRFWPAGSVQGSSAGFSGG